MSTVAYAALWIFLFTLPWESAIVVPGVNGLTPVTGGLALAAGLTGSAAERCWRPSWP